MFPVDRVIGAVDVFALLNQYRDATDADFILSVIYTESYWVPISVLEDPECLSFKTALEWLETVGMLDKRDDFIYRCASISYDNDCHQIETFLTITDPELRAHYKLYAEQLNTPYIKWYTP